MCDFSDDRAGGTLVVWTIIKVQAHLPGNSPLAKLGRKPCCAGSLRPSASVAMNYVEGEGCINSFPLTEETIIKKKIPPTPTNSACL